MKKYFVTALLLAATVASTPSHAAGQSGGKCNPAQRAAISFSSSGDNTVIAANTNLPIYVWQFFFVNNDASTATNITLKEGSTSISGAYKIAAGGSHTAGCTGVPWAIVPAGSAFVINSSAAVSVTGTVYYSNAQ